MFEDSNRVLYYSNLFSTKTLLRIRAGNCSFSKNSNVLKVILRAHNILFIIALVAEILF